MAGKTILIIEDNPNIRSVLKDILILGAYNVVTAENGQQALDLLPSIGTPDLILLDLMMPVMNGWEFLATYKQRIDASARTIVITSAIANERTCRDLGVASCLPKPIDVDVLLETIERICAA